MKSSLLLVAVLLLYMVLGAVAVETGLVEPSFVPEQLTPDSPASSGGIWATITSALAPLGWAFNAVSALLTLASYQADVPPAVNTILFVPLGLVLVITVIKLARGTSN